MNSEQEMQALNRIGQILLEFAPEGWHRIECTVAFIGVPGELWEKAIMEDGTEQNFGTSIEIFMQFQSLRAIMYRPDKGTWFSASYQLTRPSSFAVSYNFDHEKKFGRPEPSVIDYFEDFEEFPRSPENTPAWLQEKIDEAERLINTPRQD